MCVGPRDRFGDGFGALGEARPLEDAHRAVPEHGLRVGDRARERLARLGADVEPEPAVRELVVGNDLRLRVLGELGRGDDVCRQLDLERERVLDAHLLGHLAADQHPVGLAAEVLEHPQLVVDLGAAGDEHERPLDLAEQLAELLELALEQQPRVGGEHLGHADRRRVRPVRRAERVVDEQVEVVGELPREPGVVRRLARVEACVLEHANPLVWQVLVQPSFHRLHRERGVLPLRPAEVRADDDLRGVAFEQEFERGQRGPDPRVVRHVAVLERDVQVRADEHPPAGDSGVSNGARAPQSRRSIRSTSRHE